jgi:hypothetical protein
MTAATRPTRRLAVVALVVAALLGTATACGSDDGAGDDDDVASLDDGTGSDATTDDTTATSAAPEDIEDAVLAFAQCMRDHGVDMPDPQIDGEGGVAIAIEGKPGDEATMEEAQAACEPLMENARGDMDIDPEQRAEMQAEMLEFAECMREHGIDMDDPVFGDDGRITQRGPGPDAEGAELDGDEFTAAADECGRGEGGPMIAATPSGADAGDGPSVQSDDDDGEDD